MEANRGECVGFSEVDPNAIAVYRANWPADPPSHNLGNIRDIRAGDLPGHDILCGGFPCQKFSIIGDRSGFEDQDQGNLFFEIIKLVRQCRPRVLFLENVKNLVSHDQGRTFAIVQKMIEDLGYHFIWRVLDAQDFGLAQHRERVYIVAFRKAEDAQRFELPIGGGERACLADVLRPCSDTRFDPKPEQLGRVLCYNPRMRRVLIHHLYSRDIAGTLIANYANLRRPCSALVREEDGRLRLFSPAESLALMGFPPDFKLFYKGKDLRPLYHMVGNSVPVAVVRAIGQAIVHAISGDQPDNRSGFRDAAAARQSERVQ
jgi:DNA (cytosine-5)-methyltransferase 1